MTKDSEIKEGNPFSNEFGKAQLEALHLANTGMRQETRIKKHKIILEYINIYYRVLGTKKESFSDAYKTISELLFGSDTSCCT